jgi:hypothetical protein
MLADSQVVPDARLMMRSTETSREARRRGPSIHPPRWDQLRSAASTLEGLYCFTAPALPRLRLARQNVAGVLVGAVNVEGFLSAHG